ncbi:helix-turn-helix transcriptional regulator [Nesterenkonia ebinurensis]|uniref:helix-turn-helix transcriptional regulator n=1 Tax=Nesterenkonia ebinurensis TaxID=2608252 RepID=UPI00123CFA64|nr:helix-turn-helix transcriptional regulator [Nesterenkonia ebinurensis]
MVPRIVESTTPRVRTQRRSRGLTQAQLAKAVGVSRQTIVSLERGDYAPSVYLALRIGAELGTSVEELFGGTDQQTATRTGGAS